jgi:4-aminobutyrate aminotransferase-like enzyme
LRRLQKSSECWGNVGGLGLMQGIEVVRNGREPDAARTGALVEAMLARGVILLSSGVGQNILSFTPPFVIGESEIDFALAQLAEAARAI